MSRTGSRLGHLGALAGAALVLLSLWLPWYDAETTPAVSGWQGLAVADVLFAALGIAVVALVAASTGALRAESAAQAVSALATLSLLLAVEHVLVRPGHADLGRGVWMAVLGSLVMIVGGAAASAPPRRHRAPQLTPSA